MKQPRHYETIASALYWLVENRHSQPSLESLSTQFGLSESHLQRVFQDYAGVSPKQFLKFLGKEEALQRLRQGATVLDTALDVGLSGPGRLHDLLLSTEAFTPGQIRRRGRGVQMKYGFGPSPFGDAMIAWTPMGISFLAFCHLQGRKKALRELQSQWQDALLSESPDQAGDYLSEVFTNEGNHSLKVWLRGTPFQLKVWEALLRIPPSTHCTYGQIAEHLGNPKASRAVGSAVGRNPVSWLIPCHRVLTSIGTLGGYRWGSDTKMAMIGLEAGRNRGAA